MCCHDAGRLGVLEVLDRSVCCHDVSRLEVLEVLDRSVALDQAWCSKWDRGQYRDRVGKGRTEDRASRAHLRGWKRAIVVAHDALYSFGDSIVTDICVDFGIRPV